MPNTVDTSFNSGNLSSAELCCANGILDVSLCDRENCFGYYSSHCLHSFRLEAPQGSCSGPWVYMPWETRRLMDLQAMCRGVRQLQPRNGRAPPKQIWKRCITSIQWHQNLMGQHFPQSGGRQVWCSGHPESKITGWIDWGSLFMMESTDAGMPGGCLSARMSRTLLGCERPMSTSSSRPSGIPVSMLARTLRAPHVFPCDIKLAKDLARLSSFTGGEFLPKRDWMVFPWTVLRARGRRSFQCCHRGQ